MDIKFLLLIVLGIVASSFVLIWWLLARRDKDLWREDPAKDRIWYHGIVAFVMCFFDTLGIGNYATTTSAFKFRRSIPDEKIPGTLNIGYAIPTIAQAFIYITAIHVEIWTLILMISASIAGAWFGAGFVRKSSRRK